MVSELHTLGNRIRKLREMQKITREGICQDETELSVRQLARIEKGESVPSLSKLSFIANKLDLKVEALLNLSNLYEYCKLKNKLELLASDYDSKKNIEIDESLDVIYDYYYDDLPLEEQMYIDCAATSHEIRQSLDTKIAHVTLNKYRHVLTSKKLYSSNELAYIALYAWVVCIEKKEMEIDENVLNIHKNIETEDQISIELSIRTQINIASYFYYQERYDECSAMLKYAEALVNNKKIFQRLPIIYMLNGKCLKALNHEVDARNYYDKAIVLAQMLDLVGLEAKIKDEYNEDFGIKLI